MQAEVQNTHRCLEPVLSKGSEKSLQCCAQAFGVILIHSEVGHYSYPPLAEGANCETPGEQLGDQFGCSRALWRNGEDHDVGVCGQNGIHPLQAFQE